MYAHELGLGPDRVASLNAIALIGSEYLMSAFRSGGFDASRWTNARSNRLPDQSERHRIETCPDIAGGALFPLLPALCAGVRTRGVHLGSAGTSMENLRSLS